MKMRNVIFLLSLSALMSAQSVSDAITQAETGAGAIGAGQPLYDVGILQDWRALSIGLAIIMLTIIAFARMLADPFNLPELKAWANLEWSQAIVTALIVGFAVVAVSFLDVVVMEEVNNSPGSPVHCNPGDLCMRIVADTYLDGLIDITQQNAMESFTKSVSAARVATQRTTISCSTLLIPPCLWFYVGWANNGFLILDTERYNQEMEQLGMIQSSLGLQKFFVDQVAFVVGPSLLLIGIVGRSFFLTRRAGGLMIAAAMGIMFIFPMMYLWNMITLNVTVYGDRLFETNDPNCPAECGYTPDATINCFSEPENLSINAGCPYECRELPYPYANQLCSDPKVEKACMDIPRQCKVIRIAKSLSCGGCPSDCKIKPPLAGNKTCTSCFVNYAGSDPKSIPFSCRVALNKVFYDRTGTVTEDASGRIQSCIINTTPDMISDFTSAGLDGSNYVNDYVNATLNCHMDLNNPYNNCMYIVPELPDCECIGEDCCINNDESTCRAYQVITNTPVYDKNNVSIIGYDKKAVERFDCVPGQETTCLNYTNARAWHNETSTCSCLGSECRNPGGTLCSDQCMNVSSDACLFNPAVNPGCSDECSQNNIEKPALLTPAEFVKRSGEGMYGREDIKNVSKLLLPAYLLPLINIIVTLMFIRVFSPLLGGDMDLPGYTKVI